MNATLKKFLDKTGDLPAVPSVAAEVMERVESPDTSVEDIKNIIERDPGIAARVLKVANSSLYGFSREIETLSHAITLLGFRTVRTLVMAMSMNQAFKHFGLAEKLLWEHSVMAGAVGGGIATYGGVGLQPDEGFTVGILHDVGKIALSNACHDEYGKVIARVYNEGISFVEAEREAFGFDHAEIGACIAEKWKLPHILEVAIGCHHSPEKLSELSPEEAKLTALATVSTACCTRFGVGRRGPVNDLDPTALPAWGVLGLKPEDGEPVLELAAERIEQASEVVK